MSKLSYQLSVKKYQRELGLDDRKFNALDVKYNDINLLKQLQLLNPVIVAPVASVASAPPANTGFYGELDITNETALGSLPKNIYARLYYNGSPLNDEITIVGNNTGNLPVNIAARLPNPSSTLVLQIRFEAGLQDINLDAFLGFTPGNFTENPLTENNYLDMVVDSNQIDGGNLSITFVLTTPD
jgi:hypothetical protein